MLRINLNDSEVNLRILTLLKVFHYKQQNNCVCLCVCVLSQSADASLDVRHPAPLLLSVRTKKRYFIPPTVGMKGRGESNPEAKARAAGIVFRQEYFERPINIACSGGCDILAGSSNMCLLEFALFHVDFLCFQHTVL